MTALGAGHQYRIDEIEGQLRRHRFYGLSYAQLPPDIRSPAYTDIARRAVEREQADLARLGERTGRAGACRGRCLAGAPRGARSRARGAGESRGGRARAAGEGAGAARA